MATMLTPRRELESDGDAASVIDERNVALSLDLASAALRLVIGVILLGHGLQKFGLFEGGGLPSGIREQA